MQVRNVLSALADLLAGMEVLMKFAPGTSKRLRSNVSKIDEYMAALVLEQQQNQIFHTTPLAAQTQVQLSASSEETSNAIFPAGSIPEIIPSLQEYFNGDPMNNYVLDLGLGQLLGNLAYNFG